MSEKYIATESLNDGEMIALAAIEISSVPHLSIIDGIIQFIIKSD